MEQLALQLKFIDAQLSAKPSGVTFVQFDDPETGNSSMSSHRHDELKDCAPNEPVTQQFSVSKNKSRNSDLKGERERERERERDQFPLHAAHAMAVHKSQGSTIAYPTGDMDQSTKNPSQPKTPSIKVKLMKVCFNSFFSCHKQ